MDYCQQMADLSSKFRMCLILIEFKKCVALTVYFASSFYKAFVSHLPLFSSTCLLDFISYSVFDTFAESICHDNHRKCKEWSLQDQCVKNAEWMLENCAKSCNSCRSMV